jgi:hypothetical protein
MTAKKNISGIVKGRLTALRPTGRKIQKSRRIEWEFVCECGNICFGTVNSFLAGKKLSCGCLQKDRTSKSLTTHGMKGTKIYQSWQGMKARCYNKNHKSYSRYGGRGITVCCRWRCSFDNFYMDMGHPLRGATLDRIDNDGPYSKENCRWATILDQANNRENTRIYTWAGETLSIRQWERKLGFKPGVLWRRLTTSKMPFFLAIHTPIRIYSLKKHKEQK